MVIPFKRHEAFFYQYPVLVSALITPVKLMPPTLTHQFTPDKATHQCNALWDTGATNTVITQAAAQSIGIQPTGQIPSIGVHGRKIVNTYLVDIILPNNVLFQNVNVSEGLLGEEISILIGMDIIQAGDFVIANANGKTRFSYCCPPHKNPICLVEKSTRVNESIDKKNKRSTRP